MLVLCVLLGSGCRSLDGLSGGEPAADAATDGGDAGIAQCTPTAGVGTLCVTVRLDEASTSPGYGAFSGAGTVKADGVGFVQVFLFDKDPSETANGHILPKVTLRHPPAAGATMELSGLPVELVGNAAPQKYWVYALFEDNELDPRGTGLLHARPGDFVTPEAIDSPGELYPAVTLADGQTHALDIAIKPLRELTLSCKASANLLSQAQSNPSIHGDGPGAFFLYEGSLMAGAPKITDFGQVTCIDLQLQAPQPPVAVTAFGVTSVGSHNIFGDLFDYQSPTASGGFQEPPGTIQTSAVTPPVAIIDETSWTAVVDVDFVNVPQPVTGTPTDPLHCK